MGILVTKNNDERSILQERINADLRARMQASATDEGQDFASSADCIADTTKTGRFAWVWVVLIALAILSIVLIVII